MSTGASVGEHLYGLVQVTKSQTGTYKPLTSSEKKMCVISMLLPFALLKLKEVSLTPEDENEDENEDTPIDEKSSRNSARRFFSLLHQYLHRLKTFFVHLIKRHKVSIAMLCMLQKMATATQQLSFLFSFTSSFYPIHQILNITLIRKKHLSVTRSPSSGAVLSRSVTSQTSPTTTNHAVTVLFISALCLKVTEMLNRVDTSSTSAPSPSISSDDDTADTGSLALPDPPTVRTHYCTLPTDPSLCPLCKLTRQDPCASRGGYVFCYSCLCQSITRHPFCPITGIGCTLKDVIRLSES